MTNVDNRASNWIVQMAECPRCDAPKWRVCLGADKQPVAEVHKERAESYRFSHRLAGIEAGVVMTDSYSRPLHLFLGDYSLPVLQGGGSAVEVLEDHVRQDHYNHGAPREEGRCGAAATTPTWRFSPCLTWSSAPRWIRQRRR